MLISTNLADFKNERLADNPFYEQIKAINTALGIFAKKQFKNIQSFMDGNEARGVEAKVTGADGVVHQLLVLETNRRYLFSVSKRYSADIMSVVYHIDADEFQQIEIQADPAQFLDEESKWALAHIALQMVYTITMPEDLGLRVRNEMQIEIYEKTV